jgi:AcrR family transcriptional regulator
MFTDYLSKHSAILSSAVDWSGSARLAPRNDPDRSVDRSGSARLAPHHEDRPGTRDRRQHVPDTEPIRRGRGRPSKGAREAILTAALEVIGEQGLARLTTREVARRAGVSEASVFYHYRDKVSLLQAVTLAALEPLKALDLDPAAGQSARSLSQTLLAIGTALEGFFDGALPILEMVQADPAIRTEFAHRLSRGNYGPHRGVGFVSEHLGGMVDLGRVRPDVDTDAAALLLVGACFLRAWLRHLAGPGRADTLPRLEDTTAALAALLAPPDAG